MNVMTKYLALHFDALHFQHQNVTVISPQNSLGNKRTMLLLFT